MTTANVTTRVRPAQAILSSIRRHLARPAAWHTPHGWADAGGLYATDAQAWLYYELPLTLLRPTDFGETGLDVLLRSLATLGPGRQVHVVMHTWEERATPPVGTPDGLAEYLAGALTFFVPTRHLLLGVRLEKSAEAADAEGSARGSATATLDRLLGEQVPDLSAYDTDRDGVTAVLTHAGGTPPSRAAASHLESWYTLGAGSDVRSAFERDDVITLDQTSVIELVAVAGIDPHRGADVALGSAGRRGATVASARGVLATASRGARDEHTGALSKVSVILGRRSDQAATPWSVSLRRHDGLEQRPLPMRQLSALDETLPCSSLRLSPDLTRVRTQHLAKAGFCYPIPAGDDHGIFVGLSGTDFSHPTYINPSTGGNVTLVTGAPKSGRTFLAESVAIQSALAGQRVVYMTTSSDAGGALRDLIDTRDLTLDRKGAFDPFRWLPAGPAAALAHRAIALLIPTLTAEEQRDLDAGLRRASAVGEGSFERVFALADGSSAVARIRQALTRSPYAATAVSDHGDPIRLAPITVLDLAQILPFEQEAASGPDQPQAHAVADLAVACVLEHAMSFPHPQGTLVVVDGAFAAITGSLTTTTAARLPGTDVHLLATTTHTVKAATAPLTTMASRVLALAEDNEEAASSALAMCGVGVTPERVSWLTHARADITESAVHRPAMGVLRDHAGRQTSLLLGPAPLPALRSLTRGAADQYATT